MSNSFNFVFRILEVDHEIISNHQKYVYKVLDNQLFKLAQLGGLTVPS